MRPCPGAGSQPLTRAVAILVVFLELAPPVLFGADPCVSELDHPCHVDGDGGDHGHTELLADAPHDDLGAVPAHGHDCFCTCHTPLVLRAAPALAAVVEGLTVHADAPDGLVAGYSNLLFRPPRHV